MNILSFDTSAAACSVGLLCDGQPVENRSEAMHRGQSERLIPLLQEVLDSGGLVPSDLDAVATTVGPGAFTGIRIGLSTARAFGLALNIPVLGFTSTEVIAAGYTKKDRIILVAIETKRADIYIAIHGMPNFSSAPMALPMASAVKLVADFDPLLVGDGAGRMADALTASSIPYRMAKGPALPDPIQLACLAREAFDKKGATAFAAPPRPLYIRPPDVTKPKPNLRAGR